MAAQPTLMTLHIQLEPLHLPYPVWRRLQVSADCTLRKLHHFIQAAFGWHSCHLHEFNTGLHRYAEPDEYGDLDTRDDRKIKLRRVLNPDVRLRYVYDFGDAWQHVIALEDTVPWQSSGTWCEVLDGAGACPPEDVGGVPGYLHFLEALQHPDSDEGRDALEWIGGQFDPQRFDVHGANAAVQRICNNLWG
ncbi:MAG: plasmid pRiA4b ORF-3 family protein [Pseudomonadaceae bacterium]